MRKSNLKILSLCVVIAGVFGLQSGVNAQNYCSSGTLKHVAEFAACAGKICKRSLAPCHKFCKDEEIRANHSSCATAANLTEEEAETEEDLPATEELATEPATDE